MVVAGRSTLDRDFPYYESSIVTQMYYILEFSG